MGPGIFLIAIMGCGEGDAPCQQVRLLNTQYQSRAECMAASEGALVANSNVEYPSVVAQCVTPCLVFVVFLVLFGVVSLPAAPVRPGLGPSRIASRR